MRTRTLCTVLLLAFSAIVANAQPGAVLRLPASGAIEDSDCPDLSTARASLSAQPGQVAYGQSITLRWQAQLPEECLLFLGETPVESQGSLVLTPAHTTTFVMTVRSLNRKRAVAAAGVAVSFPPRWSSTRSPPTPAAPWSPPWPPWCPTSSCAMWTST